MGGIVGPGSEKFLLVGVGEAITPGGKREHPYCKWCLEIKRVWRKPVEKKC